MDPSNQRKEKEHIPRVGDILRVNASNLPGTVSRGNDLSAVEANSSGRRMMGWSFQKAGASAPFACLGGDHRVVSPFWALCLTVGSLQCGDSGRCWEFLGLTNTLNEF